VANILILAASAPATVHLRADAGNLIRTADKRWFGLNTAVWDDSLDTANQSNALKQVGCTTLRFPGGSLSDEYHWATNSSGTNSYVWNTSFGNFMHIATNLGEQAFITVNYGTGTSNEAAAWVANANITNHCNFKYWEIGNEVYGTWEVDSNTLPNDPYTYATRAAGYIQLMKAKDPTIKIGMVAVAGEDNSSNNATHFAINPITGKKHYGWTPVMLNTLKSLGIYPDFLIYHYYYEYSPGGTDSSDSDPLLLQVADNYNAVDYSDWASAAQSLRLQLTDYLGTNGSNIELCVTENNSDSGPSEGKQSTGIVNALYLADSSGQLMKTEFNSLIWWDLWNGPDYGGDFDATLYGWRNYGDLGIMTGTSNFYPVFYAKKLLQNFVRAGDSVATASSDYLLLSDYHPRGARRGSLTMLVINKDVTTNFNAQIVLTNFVPAPNATIQSYGIAQDNATETNAVLALQDIATNNFPGATTNFNYTFPAGTMTLFTFSPAAVKLQSSLVSGGKFLLQFLGQTNTPYVVQESPDLYHWTSVSTNISTSPTVNVTNAVSTSPEFWRVIWQP
jgi:alpha-N-arabinofuranosidase